MTIVHNSKKLKDNVRTVKIQYAKVKMLYLYPCVFLETQISS